MIPVPESAFAVAPAQALRSPDPSDAWVHRRAAPIRPADRRVLLGLIAAGSIAVARLAEWWFRADHVGVPVLFVLLSLAFWYGIARMVIGWIGYAAIRHPPHVPAPPDRRVAIFTTSSPGEPLAMFEKTLEACARIRYPHTTYLLDDTRDPRFGELAGRLGAVHLEIIGVPGAKAGKINHALGLTDEPLVLVLDPDHVPFPDMLDRVLGHFDDPSVGFVQVSQAYYNQDRSFVARAAAEQTYGFYGPMQSGLFGHGCAVAIGANCTFRRSALESIGGHGIGLAEDLVTSIRLHAAGWRSVYVPEIVSRGLVPEDLGSFFRQQLKWARGVYEVAFTELPALFPRLTWRQRLSYAAVGTYYLFGVTTALCLALPYLYLWTGVQPAAMRFHEFVLAGGPVALLGIAIYLFAQRWLCHPETERGLHWRGLVLKLACWPVFVAGIALAVVRADLPYTPTEKRAVRGRFLRVAWPHLLVVASFLLTLVVTTVRRLLYVDEATLRMTSEAVWGMLGFAALPAVLMIGALHAAWQVRRPPAGDAWDDIAPPARNPTPTALA
jgi:cellulose synthase (UDP-forming)